MDLDPVDDAGIAKPASLPSQVERSRWQWLLGSVVAFLGACATPALLLHARFNNGRQLSWVGYRSIRGLDLLFTGLAFAWMKLNFAGYANLALWFGWLMLGMGRCRAARTAAIAALILSVQTLQLLVQPYIWDEGASVQGYLSAPRIGYFLWIASMGALWYGSDRGLTFTELL